MAKKTLIVYYSWSQTTKRMAESLKKVTQADLVELTVPAGTFSSDMYQTSDMAQAQLRANKLPELTNDTPNIDDYDLILVGGPVWSGEVATPVRSFLNQLTNFKGQVAPFYTSAGSDEKYGANFQSLTKVKTLSGLGLTASDLSHAEPTLKNWWENLNN